MEAVRIAIRDRHGLRRLVLHGSPEGREGAGRQLQGRLDALGPEVPAI
jgi:hypothetical protein